MAKRGRKPIPKTQKEIANSLVNPYDKTMGNPNNGFPNDGNKRAYQQSFREDTTKPFSIGIQDIDESMFYYFENVIRPYVNQNGERLKVPVIYGSPERWKSVQRDGYYRDRSGAIMNPLIMIKRDTITKNRSVANKLDANNPLNFGVFEKKFDRRNAYDNFSVLNNRIPEKTYHAVVVPDYVTIEYSCIISTYYVDQLNKIVEAINYASDAYWGDPERFKFRARIDSFTTIQEVTAGQERIVKSNFNIKLYGYIIPDALQKDLKSVKKFNEKAKITFAMEVTNNQDIFDGNVEGNRIVTQDPATTETKKRANLIS